MVPRTKLGAAVAKVVKKIMIRSIILFRFSAAILPSTNPVNAASRTAHPPSLAEMGKDSPMTVEIFLQVFKETPRSPRRKFPMYITNCSGTGLSRLYLASNAAFTSALGAFSELKGPPGMAFIPKKVMAETINTVKMASRTRLIT